MTPLKRSQKEGKRLKNLWSGEFGNDYVDRNINAGEGRGPFWKNMFSHYEFKRVLEVGCNVGGNLQWIASLTEPQEVYGVDVNQKALEILRIRLPSVNTLWGMADALPFANEWFDLVFTMGVLIHLPPESLSRAMAEIVRCSSRYVLCGEYYSKSPVDVPYRGQRGALFKRDYGALYRSSFPQLKLIKTGHLSQKKGGWDDVTYWLFEKTTRP
jgi:pseudaminic acid biosynthesis-associated methylase